MIVHRLFKKSDKLLEGRDELFVTTREFRVVLVLVAERFNGVDARSIQDQNIKLDQVVRLENDVITYLEKNKEDMEDENRGYKRDLDQNMQTLQEYA